MTDNKNYHFLSRLEDECIEDILEMSDEEVIEEAKLRGYDIDSITEEHKRLLKKLIKERK